MSQSVGEILTVVRFERAELSEYLDTDLDSESKRVRERESKRVRTWEREQERHTE